MWRERICGIRQSLRSFSHLHAISKKNPIFLSRRFHRRNLAPPLSSSIPAVPPPNPDRSQLPRWKELRRLRKTRFTRTKSTGWGFAMDPNYGIPRLCHCGEELTEVVFEDHPQDTCPGKRYIICTKYKKSGGPHIRTPWVLGVSEELERRQRRLEMAEMDMKELKELKKEMAAMREEVSHLRHRMANLTTRVVLLEDSSDSD